MNESVNPSLSVWVWGQNASFSCQKLLHSSLIDVVLSSHNFQRAWWQTGNFIVKHTKFNRLYIKMNTHKWFFGKLWFPVYFLLAEFEVKTYFSDKKKCSLKILLSFETFFIEKFFLLQFILEGLLRVAFVRRRFLS